MDSIEREVLALGRRLLNELRSINAVLLELQKEVRSVRDQQKATSKYRQQNQQQPQIFQAELQIPEAAQRENRTSRNRQLVVQAVLVAVTFLAFLAAAIYAGVAYRQWREMKRAADAAKSAADTAARSLELSNRSWVRVMDLKPRGNGEIKALSFQDLTLGHLTGMPPGLKYQVTLNYEVDLKIVGASPALNIAIGGELYLAPWGAQAQGGSNAYAAHITDEEKKVCDDFSKSNRNITGAGTAAFPDESPTKYQANAALVYEQTINRFRDLPGDYILPTIIGCVDYQFQSSDRHHQTRFVYEILHAHEPRNRFFLIGKGVSADDLLVIRDAAADYAY